MAETREWYEVPGLIRVFPGLSDDQIDELAARKVWHMHPDFRAYLRHVNGATLYSLRRAGRCLAFPRRSHWSEHALADAKRRFPEVDVLNWPPTIGKFVSPATIFELLSISGIGSHEEVFSFDDPRRGEWWLEPHGVVIIGFAEYGELVLIDLRKGPCNGRIYVMDRDFDYILGEEDIEKYPHMYPNGIESLLEKCLWGDTLREFFESLLELDNTRILKEADL